MNKIVHCDIKPENLLLCNNGRIIVKISDFGNSKISDIYKKQVFGTVKYSPPEVFIGATRPEAEVAVTPKFDVFGLGLVLYKLITGEGLYSSRIPAVKKAKSSKHIHVLLLDWFNQETPSFDIAPLPRCVVDDCLAERFNDFLRLHRKMLRIYPIERPSAPQLLSKLNDIFSQHVSPIVDMKEVHPPIDNTTPTSSSLEAAGVGRFHLFKPITPEISSDFDGDNQIISSRSVTPLPDASLK